MTMRPIEMLTAAFRESVSAAAIDANGRGVAIAWPSVPIEIVRAAGFVPIFARGGFSATPMADAYLEPGIFPNRLRSFAEALLAGGLSSAASIVIPRTSDPDYKFFLYLRELVRLEIAPVLPAVLLFDLLQSAGP